MAKKEDSIFVLCISLAIIAAVAAGVLALANQLTLKARNDAKLKQTVEALKKLQPALTNNPDAEKKVITNKEKQNVTFYPATADGKLLSIIGEAISPIGYGGNMTVLVAFAPDGAIQNVLVTANKETPGLGTVVVDRVRQKTIKTLLEGSKKNQNSLPPNKFLDQFDGKIYVPADQETAKEKANPNYIPSTKFKVKKDGGDIDEVSGATISSRACTYGVKIIVSTYYNHKAELLSDFSPKQQ
jgi:electron transport complex protein RnfG